jgi:hypothetical protein
LSARLAKLSKLLGFLEETEKRRKEGKKKGKCLDL